MWWLIALVVTCLFYYSWQRLRYFSTRGVSTLPPFPFFGNLTAVTFGRENFVDAIASGYVAFKDQRYFGLYQYHVPTVITRDPELIRQIMVRDFSAFTDRGVHIPADCDPLFGRNLIMLKGSKWREMRAAISPAFSGARARTMVALMADCASATMQHIDMAVCGKEIDTDTIVTPYVNDVIASCAFGFAVDSLQDPGNCIYRLGQTAVIQHTTQVMKLFGYENFPRLMKFLGVKMISSPDAEKFGQLFKSALNSRRQNGTQPRPDFIQTLVDAAQGKLKQEAKDTESNQENTDWTKNFSDDDLVAQAVLFYVAGFDTTANLINFFLYEMAVNLEVQERLLKEIDEVADEGDLYEKVQAMEYLEMCVSEVLRLWPLVGAADRRSVTTYNFGPTHPDSKHELIAPPGTHVWLPIYSLHRDPEFWPAPDLCDPERFAPGNKAKIRPYTYMPFGTGPRHCVGSRFAVLAAKIFIVNLLKGHLVRASGNTPRPQRIAPRAFILRPVDGFHLIVQPRSIY